MIYLKHFSAHTDYETYINGSDKVLPNVSICDDDAAGTVHFNPASSIPEGAVDLGLSSGTLWCSHNVGTATETDYGDYFMWGSTIPNTDTP